MRRMAETRVLPEDKPESPAGREPLINAITTSCPSRIRLAEVLLVFGEGTRSRAGSMQRTLPGVTRYFENPGTRIVPVGILGTETLFPVGEDTFRPVRIEAHVGKPLEADALRARAKDNRRLMMDCIGLAIAHLLPGEYRGVYGDDSSEMEEMEEARDLYRELSA
jgi:1-acyl-sn-glycerol-3-phosphate acyltransferase